MEAMGYILGSAGFVFALVAMGNVSAINSRVNNLEKKLKEHGILDDEK